MYEAAQKIEWLGGTEGSDMEVYGVYPCLVDVQLGYIHCCAEWSLKLLANGGLWGKTISI